MNTRNKVYELSDGSKVTIDDVMRATGMSYVGCYSRLRRCSSPEDVFGPKKTGGRHAVPLVWESKPTQVIGGLQFKADWEDGKILTRKGPMHNRDGYIMTSREGIALSEYREKMRQQWRAENPFIINRECEDDE